MVVRLDGCTFISENFLQNSLSYFLSFNLGGTGDFHGKKLWGSYIGKRKKRMFRERKSHADQDKNTRCRTARHRTKEKKSISMAKAAPWSRVPMVLPQAAPGHLGADQCHTYPLPHHNSMLHMNSE